MAFDCFPKFPCFLSNICATVYALFTLNFFASSNVKGYQRFHLQILIAVISLSVIIFVFHAFLAHLHERRMKSNLEQARRNFQIGFGLITLLGILPYIFYWYYGKGNDASILAFFILNICTTPLFLIFINPYTPEYGLDQNRRGKYHKFSLIASLLASTVWLVIAKGGEWPYCLEIQTIWAIANHGFYADFLIAITDGVREKNDEIFGRSQVSYGTEPVQHVEGADVPEEFTMNSEELECKVCYRFYSDKNRARAPLVLTSCGHSLCRECCEVILKKEKNFNVCCPTCRRYTYVKDSVNVLPKNEAILAMIKIAQEQVEGGQE